MGTRDILFLSFISVAFALFMAMIFIQPYFEMRTFNRFSKVKASYVDALYSELRIYPIELQPNRD